MRLRTGMMLAALAAASCAPPLRSAEHARHDPAEIATVAKSAVIIQTELTPDEVRGDLRFGLGAGTVIDSRGRVLTALHVVGRSTVIHASAAYADENDALTHTGKAVRMRLVAVAPDLDAALLAPMAGEDAAPLTAIPPLALAPRQATEGEPVCALLRVTGWNCGMVTHVDYPMPDLATVEETNVPSQHGDSGSPFVDGSGRLLGFLTKGRANGRASYFIPAIPALEALDVPVPRH